jgi:hypothetical protein
MLDRQDLTTIQSKTPSTESLTFSQIVGNNFKDFKRQMMQRSPKSGAYLAHQIMIDASKLYHIVEVEKKGTTEKRKCYAPCYSLKQLQKSLLREIETKTQPHQAAHGFRKGRSNATAAYVVASEMKTTKYTVINQDLQKAFPTMKSRQIRKIFRILKFNTWQVHIAAKICSYRGELATGSPTSPMLLNLELYRLDEKLSAVAKKHGGTFVRYADDLTLSINTHKQKVINKIKAEMRKTIIKAGFIAHPQKRKVTRIGKDSDKAETVGISLTKNCTRPPQRQRRVLFHLAKAFNIATTSADEMLSSKVRNAAIEAEKDDPLKWKGLGFFAYFHCVKNAQQYLLLTGQL